MDSQGVRVALRFVLKQSRRVKHLLWTSFQLTNTNTIQAQTRAQAQSHQTSQDDSLTSWTMLTTSVRTVQYFADPFCRRHLCYIIYRSAQWKPRQQLRNTLYRMRLRGRIRAWFQIYWQFNPLYQLRRSNRFLRTSNKFQHHLILTRSISSSSRLSSFIIRILNHHTLLEHEKLLRQNVVHVVKPHVCPKILSLKIDPGGNVDVRAYLWSALPNVIGDDVHCHVKGIAGLSWNATWSFYQSTQCAIRPPTTQTPIQL